MVSPFCLATPEKIPIPAFGMELSAMYNSHLKVDKTLGGSKSDRKAHRTGTCTMVTKFRAIVPKKGNPGSKP